MRREPGALEAEVLAVLWAAGGPCSPEEVRSQLSGDLAYTTVLTILVRLHDKGAVRRQPHGRGYAYAPVLDEAGLAARRLRAALDQEGDRAAVLRRFVGGLDEAGLAALRAALESAGEAR